MTLTREVEEIVVPAWPKRADKAAAWTARNQADALCEQLAQVSAVAAWAAAHNYAPGQHKQVNPSGKAGGYAVALRNYLDGTRLLTLNPRHEYPSDLDDEPREMDRGHAIGQPATPTVD